MKCARPGFFLVFLAAVAAVKLRTEVKAEHPIKRVIRLVQELAAKSVEEGKEEQLTYDKFVAWCEKSTKGLKKAIGKETEVVDKTSGKIEAKSSEKEQLTESIEGLTKELAELEASAAAASGDRADQIKQQKQTVKDLTLTIESLGTAVKSLEASQVDQDVSLLSKVMEMPLVLVALSEEQQALLAQAAAPQATYDFKTGGVTELLKKLKLDFEDKLSTAEKEGAQATQEYDLAKGARDNAIKVATESKTKQEEVKAAVVSDLSSLNEKLTSANKDLEADSKSLTDTQSTCDTKAAEFKERVYMRGREQEAMKFGVQILQKATGVRTAKPASFIQMRSESSSEEATKKAEALKLLKDEAERSGNEDLRRLLLEVQGRLEGDGDVSKEVDVMLEKQLWKLRADQTKEDEKWQWCLAETNKTDLQKSAKEEDMESFTNGIKSAQGSVTELQDDIKEATKRLSDLQKSTHELKMDRQESKNEHQLALRDAQQAQEALSGAISTLTKFYEEAASLLQSSAPTEVAEAPETWSKGFTGTGQDGKGPGEAIIKVLEECSADFAQMEAETKSQETAEEADFDKELTDGKKEKARIETEKSSKEEEEARLTEKIREMSEKQKMTDRSVSLLTKYSEDLSQKCDKAAYEARTGERKKSVAELEKSKVMLKDALKETAESMLLRKKMSGHRSRRVSTRRPPPLAAVATSQDMMQERLRAIPYSSFLLSA